MSFSPMVLETLSVNPQKNGSISTSDNNSTALLSASHRREDSIQSNISMGHVKVNLQPQSSFSQRTDRTHREGEVSLTDTEGDSKFDSKIGDEPEAAGDDDEDTNQRALRRKGIISAINIHKTYLLGTDGVPALRGVSLDISRGEFIVILGKSGGGKTSLLNILGTIDRPSKGELYICNKRITATTKDEEFASIRLRK